MFRGLWECQRIRSKSFWESIKWGAMINWGAREGLLSKSGKHLTQICDGCHTVQRQWTESYGAQQGCGSPDGQRRGEWWHCLSGVSTCVGSVCTAISLWFGLDWSWKDSLFCVFSINHLIDNNVNGNWKIKKYFFYIAEIFSLSGF